MPFKDLDDRVAIDGVRPKTSISYKMQPKA